VGAELASSGSKNKGYPTGNERPGGQRRALNGSYGKSGQSRCRRREGDEVRWQTRTAAMDARKRGRGGAADANIHAVLVLSSLES